MLAIELGRTRPEAICVALHPGTVDTGLSKPFQKAVASAHLFSPEVAAAHLLDVIDELTPSKTGRYFAWDGAELALEADEQLPVSISSAVRTRKRSVSFGLKQAKNRRSFIIPRNLPFTRS